MNAACSPDPAGFTDPSRERAEGHVRLLAVVRALIAFGRHLAEALRQRDPAENPIRLIRHFGVPTVAEIVARVTYALRLALALEARLVPLVARPVAERVADVAPVRQCAKAAPRVQRDPDADEPPPDPLPSVEEIAQLIRRRPLGDVIVDICRDFGIATNHPLWREVYDALLVYTHSVIGLVRKLVNRHHAGWRLAPLADDEPAEAFFWGRHCCWAPGRPKSILQFQNGMHGAGRRLAPLYRFA